MAPAAALRNLARMHSRSDLPEALSASELSADGRASQLAGRFLAAAGRAILFFAGPQDGSGVALGW
eukprot:761404-Hanusia_phi.AAC.5